MIDALLFREDGMEALPDWAGRLDGLGSSSLLWVDLERPDGQELARLVDQLELHEESTRRLTGDEQAPYLGDFGGYLHVTAYTPTDEGFERVVCLVAKSWIATVRDGPVAVVDELRERARGAGNVGLLQGIDFLADLLTWVLEGYLRAFEEIDVELEKLDDRAMRGRATSGDTLRVLVDVRARIGRLRRMLVAHRSVLLPLTRPELGEVSTAESAQRFQELLERLREATQAARDSREVVMGSFDVLMTRVGQRTNDIMKTLTLVSLLLLPGTLIAGILGMNFKVSLFEHPGYFWVALAVIAGIAGGTLAVVRARSWI